MFLRLAILAVLVLVAGCAGISPPREETPVSGNRAVVALVDQARGDAASGREVNAAAGLERALRIEPRNPQLWQELAKLRLAQGRYGETENLARKSNSFAGEDRRIQAGNWRLIGEARVARGEEAGAREAFRRAEELGR